MAAATMSDLSIHLKAKRVAAGLSLAECARRAGLSKGYLHRVESGDPVAPSVNVLDALATVYGLRAGDLLVEAGYTVHPGPETWALLCVANGTVRLVTQIDGAAVLQAIQEVIDERMNEEPGAEEED